MTSKIAVISGKGGTGKTTLSVNLLLALAQEFDHKVKLVDCDVEEPNDLLFFQEAKLLEESPVLQKVPTIDMNKCTFCRRCAEYCEFNAITVIPSRSFAEVNPDLCHSCGACLMACHFGAVSEGIKQIGHIRCFDVGNNLTACEGRLKVGSSMQTAVIKALKDHVHINEGIIIYDAPPGTSCPVVETISDVDYTIVVTEPTPFGLHDLKLTVELLTEMDKAFGVVINKAGLGDHQVYHYLKKHQIDLIGEIPFDRVYAAHYANGQLLDHKPEKIAQAYNEITKQLKSQVKGQ